VYPFFRAERAARHFHLSNVIELAVAAESFAPPNAEEVVGESQPWGEFVAVAEVNGVLAGGGHAGPEVVRRNSLVLGTDAEVQRQPIVEGGPTVLQEQPRVLALNVSF